MDRELGLGRVQSTDWRDLNYMWSASPFALGTSDREFRYWNASGIWLDQGNKPHCVEYSLHHYLKDGPVTQSKRGVPLWELGTAYAWMQENDEWEGTGYDGTSVRAGAKFATKEGYLESYWWGETVEQVKTHVLEVSPVQVGTLWPSSMWYPNSTGLVEINDDWVGGHAYLINGYNRRLFANRGGLFRIKQSYGRNHGNRGHIYVCADDWRPLLEEYDGEAMMGYERKVA